MTGSRRPALASDDWMLEQQVRAELEAEAWRRLRADLAHVASAPAAPAQAEPEFDHHRAGSAMLKALVRFGLATFGAYLSWLAALDAQLGEFEVWLATGAGFAVALALSMLGPARDFVHMLAETARWMIIGAVGLAGLWALTQGLG